MVHEMRLHPRPFAKIKAGTKTIEMRLNDEKRREIKVGDEIVFRDRATDETVMTRVVERLEYPTFADLVANQSPELMGYDENPEPAEHGLYTYYSPEDEALYGVVGIEFEVVK